MFEAKLLNRDTIAQDAMYHRNCLTDSHEKAIVIQLDENYSALQIFIQQKLVHKCPEGTLCPSLLLHLNSQSRKLSFIVINSVKRNCNAKLSYNKFQYQIKKKEQKLTEGFLRKIKLNTVTK